MSRLPIRLRLTLPFAVAMAVMLAIVGWLIYARLGTALLSSVDAGLRDQASEAAARVHHGRALLDRDSPGGATIAQLVSPAGTVLVSEPRLRPLLRGGDLRRIQARGQLRFTRGVHGLSGDWRIAAVPAVVHGRHDVLVVGSSLEPRAEALRRLERELIFGGAAALLLAVLAGYAVGAAALRPVEAMRRRAAAITAATPRERLPLPPARDELARLAETLNEMLERLQLALEHERRFVADASHELRTPLALLKTELELALRQPRSREDLEDALQSAAEETERLVRLAEDLLLVARGDQGRIPIRPERVPARRVLEDVAARFELRASEDARRIVVEDPVDVDLDVDVTRIEQALGNLVENALAHGGGTVTLSLERTRGHVKLHVADEGRGFPEEFLPRAFDRFSRADDARSHAGTGLGLAIVALVADAHGGEAGVANLPGGGADAWIALPGPVSSYSHPGLLSFGRRGTEAASTSARSRSA